MDPEVRKYFWKIIYSFCYGMMWMLSNVMAGLYYQLAFIDGRLSLGNVLYYLYFILSLTGLIYYYYRVWNEKFHNPR